MDTTSITAGRSSGSREETIGRGRVEQRVEAVAGVLGLTLGHAQRLDGLDLGEVVDAATKLFLRGHDGHEDEGDAPEVRPAKLR